MRNSFNIEKYKSIVFDCDGVILDSNRIKSDGFRKALEGEPPELIDKFIQYHQENGGVSRYVKLQYYFTEIKKQKNYAHELDDALVRFALIVKQELLNASLVEGVEDFLHFCQSNKIPCFINSGGDQKELRQVFLERGLDQFFSKILGSPKSKKQNLEKLFVEKLLSPSTLFYGDAYSDFLAAKTYEIDFIYVSTVSEWAGGLQFCLENKIPVIRDFKHYC